jgi:hypothetical protein
MEYGVNVDTERGLVGNASFRKKTLHRALNDLLDAWEETGIYEFVLLTAHGHDPHQEALATVITTEARVRVVDIFTVDVATSWRGRPSRCTATRSTRRSCCTSRRSSSGWSSPKIT